MRAMAPPTAHQRNQNRKGCLIALAVVGGLMAILAILVSVAAYRFSRDPEVRKVFAVVKEGVSASISGMNAPGTEQLREAGCKQAMVFDTRKMVELVEELEPSTDDAPDAASMAPTIICQVGSKSALDCPTVVQVYVSAVPDAPEELIVQVQENSFMKQGQRCGGLYGRDGTLLQEFAEEEEVPFPDDLLEETSRE